MKYNLLCCSLLVLSSSSGTVDPTFAEEAEVEKTLARAGDIQHSGHLGGQPGI